MGLFFMIKRLKISRIILFVLIACLLVCYSSCDSNNNTDNSTISVRLRRGAGTFFLNEYPEASGLKYYIIMETVIDDISFANPLTIQTLIASLHDSNPLQTDLDMTCVEVMRFTFRSENGSEYTVDIIYDYVTEKEYLLYRGDLYVLQSNAFTTGFLEPYILNIFGDNGRLRFCNNEEHIFRYIQYWQDDRADYREAFEFSNLDDTVEIKEGEDAISRALAVSSMNPTDICWYYDAVTDYWMVRMYDRENPYIGERHVPYVCDVIMDKHGTVVECYITQLTNDMLMP